MSVSFSYETPCPVFYRIVDRFPRDFERFQFGALFRNGQVGGIWVRRLVYGRGRLSAPLVRFCRCRRSFSRSFRHVCDYRRRILVLLAAAAEESRPSVRRTTDSATGGALWRTASSFPLLCRAFCACRPFSRHNAWNRRRLQRSPVLPRAENRSDAYA